MRLASLLVFLLFVGCGDDAPVPDAGGGTDAAGTDSAVGAGSIELGTGTSAFVEVEDGGELVLVYGPQGGWHVDVSVRLYDLSVNGLRLTYAVRDAGDGTELGMLVYALDESRVVPEGDHLLRAGDRLIFDITDPSEVADRAVVITATAEPAAGATVDDSISVTIRDNGP